MKRVVIANLSISLMGILRRKNVLAIVLSLFIIGTAFLLIVQYEKGMVILENKWRPSCDIRKEGSFLGRSPVTKDRSTDLTRYNIKAGFITGINKGGTSIELQFCDKYSLLLNFLLEMGKTRLTVRYKTDDGTIKDISTGTYKNVTSGKKIEYPQLKNLNLSLDCDLIEKKIAIYINDKFIEKIYLGPETLHYAVTLSINSPTATLDKLEISNHNGQILFNADYSWLFFYKLASLILLSIGILIFLILAYSENRFFKKFLYFICILLSIEVFLRITEQYNQNFNIHQLNPKWRFEISTNFYGRSNDPEKITIKSYFVRPSITYLIAKPEHGKRIICMGASPVAGACLSSSFNQAFPALLEKKINSIGKKEDRVLNISFANTYINSPEPNIYLKEVLFKLNPDLILFYCNWTPPEIENSKKYIEENYTLYNRAKKAMEGNSSWIKNDRLLYAALEFKRPIKEIVYLYNFLCESYLFMGMENVRKEVFNRIYYLTQESLPDKPKSYFDETIKLCREKKIKLLLIPGFDFFYFESDPITKKEIARIVNENPDVYYLDLEEVFRRNKDFSFAYDSTHPTEYGHKIIAEEIFRKLTQMGIY